MPDRPPRYSDRRAYATRAPTQDAEDILDAPTALDPPRVTDEMIASWTEPPAADAPTSGEACSAPPARRGGALRWTVLGLALVCTSLLVWVMWRGGV